MGVDPGEHTRLITAGPFTLVRNPIYSCMLIAILGVGLLVPNVVTLLGYTLLLLAIELQVRVVEEPYLLRVHGQSYADWSARVGRFIPGVGRTGTGEDPGGASHISRASDLASPRLCLCLLMRSEKGEAQARHRHRFGSAKAISWAQPDANPPRNSHPKLTGGTDRLHAFDALRAIAMLLGIGAHAAMSYMDLRLTPLTWAYYDQSTSRVLSWVFWWMQGFRLQLFFLLAGFFAAQLYARRGGAGFLMHRTTSLLLPFVVGCLCLLPLTFYIFAGGWWLRGAATWNEIRRTTFLASELRHEVWGPAQLWFIEYLFVYCMLFWLMRLVVNRWPMWSAAGDRLARALSSRARVLWCAAPTCALLALDPAVITVHHNSFVPSPLKLVFNGLFFAIGAALYRQRNQLHRLVPGSAALLLLSLLLFAGVDSGLRVNAAAPLRGLAHFAFSACLALFAWCSIFGFVGQALRWLDRPQARLRYLAGAAYWVYLLHLPVVALLQIALGPLPIPALIKCAIVVTGTAAVCLWSYERWVRHSAIGALLRGQWPTFARKSVIPAQAGIQSIPWGTYGTSWWTTEDRNWVNASGKHSGNKVATGSPPARG